MKLMNLVYKGAHDNEYYTTYFDGTRWHGNTKISTQAGNINPQSEYNPSAAVLNNWLYIVYKAVDSSDIMCAWFDGTKWRGNVKISEMNGGISPQSNATPNVAIFNNMLYMAYLSPDSHEVYTAWFDGTTWYGNKKINDQPGGIDPESTTNPAIAAYSGSLYIVYSGRWLSDLYTAQFDGMLWSGNTKISSQPGGISPASSYTPGITVYKRRLYIVYLGAHLTDLYTADFDGTRWRGNTKIKDQPGGIAPASNFNPDMDVFEDRMYLAYKGTWFSDLYTCDFDGTTWYGNTKISSQPGGIAPASNYNPALTVTAAIPGTQANWMSRLPDTLLISEINIPGSHDAFAINTSLHTPWAAHNNSITQQLEFGIRLLDVRLRVTKSGSSFTFMTAHGSIGLGVNANTYQSFPSLMDECRAFLTANGTETVLMSLMVDDWDNVTRNDPAALTALHNLLRSYPVAFDAALPTLGSIRGKILLFNRQNDTLDLGTPIHWKGNTEGSYANPSPNRTYKVYVQDKWEGLPLIYPTPVKADLVTSAFGKKIAGEVVWNFASATWFGTTGVYVMPNLLDWFGRDLAASRPATFGWTLLDYAFNKYDTDTYGALDIVSIIIASNFQYGGYTEKFAVTDKDEL